MAKVNCRITQAPARKSRCKGRVGHELCGVNDRKANPNRNIVYLMMPQRTKGNLSPALCTGETRFEKEVEEHGKVVVGDTTTTYFALPAEALAALEKLK
jgi:hypothetical protein